MSRGAALEERGKAHALHIVIASADTPQHPRGAFRPSFAVSVTPSRKEGAGKAGCRLAPTVRCAKAHAEELHSGIQVKPNTRPSLRSGWTAYAVLSREPNSFWPPSPLRKSPTPRRLTQMPHPPHDLRRTAATLAGDLGFDDAWIAKCLDHAVSKKGDVIVPTVTGKIYNHSKRMKEKRAVLDGVAAELRRIIKDPQRRVRQEPSDRT